VLFDARLRLRVARLAGVLGLLDAAEQAVDQGLFISVHCGYLMGEQDIGQD